VAHVLRCVAPLLQHCLKAQAMLQQRRIASSFSSSTTDVSSSRKEVLMGEEGARRCLHWRLRHSAPCRRALLAPGSADRLAG